MAGKSQWGDETKDYILEQLSVGHSLRSICAVEGMPSEGLVRKWAVQDDIFGTQYVRARESGMEALSDEILEIADSQEGDVITLLDGRKITNHDAIQRAKLRVDTRKWIMSKIAPKKYGDRLDLNHSGAIGTMPEDAIDKRIAELLGKIGAAEASGGEEPEAASQ